MGETVRFGVSMDSDLVELLDKLTRQNNHDNRSQTLRSLIRKEIVADGVRVGDKEVIGTVTLLYHFQTRLPRVDIKSYPSVSITANLKMHAEGDICVKVLVVKGKAEEVHRWAQKLLSCKNIIGKLSFAGTDELYRELTK